MRKALRSPSGNRSPESHAAKRSSYIHASLLLVITSIQGLFLVEQELATVKKPDAQVAQEKISFTRMQFWEKIQHIFGNDFNPITIYGNDLIAKNRKVTHGDNFILEDGEVALDTMASVAVEKTWLTVCKLCTDTNDACAEISQTTEEATKWTTEYHRRDLLKKNQRCNNKAVCDGDAVNKHFQAYTLSMWPKDPHERLDESWHQVTFIQIGDDEYLINDNNVPIHFFGTLEQYAAGHSSKREMAIVPMVGISEVHEPKYNNPLSRFLVHVHSSKDPDSIPSSVSGPELQQMASMKKY